METGSTKRHSESQEYRNKNINFVIVKNYKRPASINIDDYVSVLENNKAMKSCDSNTNVNVIIIQNILTNKNIPPGVKIKDVKRGNEDRGSVVKRVLNNNVNFVVIRNVIPLGKYCNKQ